MSQGRKAGKKYKDEFISFLLHLSYIKTMKDF